MQLSKYFAFSPALALALLLSGGCASQPPKKTASQEGVDRWIQAQREQTPKALEILGDRLNFFENSPPIRDAVGQLLLQAPPAGPANGPPNYAEAVAILRQASALAPEEQTIREHYGLALYYNK